MQILSWADHRTLIACHCLLAAVFMVVLLILRRSHPELRGIGSMALGFSFAIPATALLSVRGVVYSTFSLVATNTFAFLCYIFFYRGILHFCQSQFPAPREERSVVGRFWGRNGFVPVLWLSSLLSTAAIFYFSQVHPLVVPRIVAVSMTVTLARVLMAVTLFRYAHGRLHMIFFGSSLLGFAMLSSSFAATIILKGSPRDFILSDSTQSFVLLAGFVFICIDGIFYVTMIGSAIARTIEQRAQLDFLTETLNRGGIEKALAMEIARTRRSRRPFSLLMIDLDHFKPINDLYGHAAGDEALRTAAQAIGSVLRLYDKLGRFGGDEFLVLLPETTGATAMQVSERIRQALRTRSMGTQERRYPSHAPGAANAMPPYLTLSIGITHCAYEEDAIDILARADSALYVAKNDGRDCARLTLPANTRGAYIESSTESLS
ncbi:GGDEF domain-containing protein [Granulicella sp. WH15]|uniref:GGDEF domain-containing protein n=1 Tax=Granulicella sp. WH15 TaxID=2602070 RepID=UPI0013679B17|nr:GGDEF domain-containing protein [Granulicella sp. WH15]QHN01973.1 GGDEF domain-containing protein [Granulicella sp. WH15]